MQYYPLCRHVEPQMSQIVRTWAKVLLVGQLYVQTEGETKLLRLV